MTKDVKIGVKSEAEIKAEVAAVWHAAERGEAKETESTHIYFTDMDTLLKTLTTRRVELLHTLRQRGPLSARTLAQTLERDYKNVHTDVTALLNTGLIERTEEGRLCVPWDRIATEINLAA